VSYGPCWRQPRSAGSRAACDVVCRELAVSNALGRKIHDCNGDRIPRLMVDTECLATSGHDVPTCLVRRVSVAEIHWRLQSCKAISTSRRGLGVNLARRAVVALTDGIHLRGTAALELLGPGVHHAGLVVPGTKQMTSSCVNILRSRYGGRMTKKLLRPATVAFVVLLGTLSAEAQNNPSPAAPTAPAATATSSPAPAPDRTDTTGAIGERSDFDWGWLGLLGLVGLAGLMRRDGRRERVSDDFSRTSTGVG